MTLIAGTKLGRYEIRSEIGARPNGKELFFVAGDQILTVLTIKLGEKVETGSLTKLFSLQSRNSDFEVSQDGQRFLINTTSGVQAAPLTVSTNWTLNLKR